METPACLVGKTAKGTVERVETTARREEAESAVDPMVHWEFQSTASLEYWTETGYNTPKQGQGEEG